MIEVRGHIFGRVDKLDLKGKKKKKVYSISSFLHVVKLIYIEKRF
jgi:hypothetical protein